MTDELAEDREIFVKKTVPNGGPTFFSRYVVWEPSKFIKTLRDAYPSVKVEVVTKADYEKGLMQ